MFVIVYRVYNVGKGLMQFVLKKLMVQLSVIEFVVYTQTILFITCHYTLGHQTLLVCKTVILHF